MSDPTTARAGLVLGGVTYAVPDGDGTRVLLDAVDLTVAPGEVVVVTGPSGSGKSTLLAVAGLLRRPQGGEVHVGGRATASLSERQRTRLRGDHVGVVYQSANLLPALTAREQLELVGHVNGVGRGDRRRRADALLADVGLAGAAGRVPAHLSGGERQRVGIARALMAEPSVLLADEPTASLDPALGVEVVRLLADEAHRREVATLIVTHDRDLLTAADRHLHLDRGTLVEHGAGRGEAPD